MTKEIINFEDFLKIDMRVGTILEVAINKKARKPAYVLRIDFGSRNESERVSMSVFCI